ncbi:ribosomal protein S17, archaeal/eukaryotic [Kipferlia bialata]|uniref:Ribosomal protein S17, archaeal/eukaryotic n=1 Tax=Kipferlia bialata TaxID=797122 RepID=A0A391P4S7_9EUKA|nr:ribosomal protein S17, archaeal/eukaryotic [Kipferlia bialata]|eukprot:g8953.t1
MNRPGKLRQVVRDWVPRPQDCHFSLLILEMDVQSEKAFQKQPTIFQGERRVLAKRNKRGANRFWRNVGLGIKTPATAIEGTFIDKKCPFTGDVAIRGRILRGVVSSTKMSKTIIVRRDYLHYVAKYKRYEKRHSNIAAHLSPAFRCKEGDVVTIGECRPLSKTVRFNVLNVSVVESSEKKRFCPF